MSIKCSAREKKNGLASFEMEACNHLYQCRRPAVSCISTAFDGPLNDAVFL